MARNRRRGQYKFTEKTNSKKAFVSLGIALFSIFLYVIFVMLSFMGAGTLSTYYGSAGIVALLGGICAVVLAIQSMMEEDSFKKYPRLATFFSIVSVLIWIITYGIGFVI